MNQRRTCGEVLLHFDALHAQLVAQDSKRTLQAVVDVQLFGRNLSFVGEFLDRHDEFGDARNAFLDGADEGGTGNQCFKPIQRVRKMVGRENVLGAGEFAFLQTDSHQRGRNRKRILHTRIRKPGGHLFFRIGLLERSHGLDLATAHCALQEKTHTLCLRGCFRAFFFGTETQRELLKAKNILPQLCRGSFGG